MAGAAGIAGAWFIHRQVWPVRGLYGPTNVPGNQSSGERKVSGTFTGTFVNVPHSSISSWERKLLCTKSL